MEQKQERGVGQPPKFKNIEELQEKIDVYFKRCEEEKKPLTITGLALALDTSRETLLNYEKDNPNFSEYFDTIKKAKLICQNFVEEFLFSGKNVVGAIFNLKNNYKWIDRQEIEHSGKVETIGEDAQQKAEEFIKWRKQNEIGGNNKKT